MTVTGFETDEEARAYADRAWAGLIWLSLKYGILSDFTVDVQNVAYMDDPVEAARRARFKDPIDGWIDGGSAAVYPTAKRIRTITAGSITPLMSYGTSGVLALIREGAGFPNSPALRRARKLRIALELYRGFFVETAPNGRFLTLMMALEALATRKPRPAHLVAMVRQWQDQVAELQASEDLADDDRRELESLGDGVRNLASTSTGQQIEVLVQATLASVGDADAGDVARRTRALYSTRSKLAHGHGVEDNVIGGAAGEAQQIVQRVLRARVAELIR